MLLDDVDKYIIELLQKNSRTSFTEIARKLNLSEAAIRKRIKKLEEKGVIKGYCLNLDFSKACKTAAIIGIDTTPEGFLKVIDYLKGLQDKNNIVEIYSSTGDHMIMIKVVFDSKKEMNEFIKKLEENKDIVKVCPAILLENLS